jgi:hypothetical protein
MDSDETRRLIERANRFYDECLRDTLELSHMNEYVIIEPDSGDHFLGRTMSEAAAGARAAHPGRGMCIMRVGHDVAIHFGIFKLFPPLGFVLRSQADV